MLLSAISQNTFQTAKTAKMSLFVHKSLYAHLRSLLERFLDDFHLGKLAVCREFLVGSATDILRDLGYCLRIEQSLCYSLLVEEYKSDKLSAPVHNDSLEHIILIVHDCLDLFRIDILAGRAENHVLGAASDEEVAVVVDDSEVSRAQEAILRECICRSLRILEISKTDILALGLDLADDIVRVIGSNPYDGAVNRLAA